MFRVYVEGKSPKDLHNNLMVLASLVGHGMEKTTSPVCEVDPTVTQDDLDSQQASLVQDSREIQVEQETANDESLVDSRGVPWNKKIHASSKEKNKDGTWRVRRGADKAEVMKIESASIQKGSPTEVAPPTPAPVITFTPPVVAAPASEMVQPALPVQPVAVAQPAPSYNPIPIPQVASQKPAHSFDTFKANFIPTIAGLIANGELTQQYVQQLNAYFNVAQIVDIKSDEAKCQQLFDALVRGGKITKVG